MNAAVTPTQRRDDDQCDRPADDQPQQSRALSPEGDTEPELAGALRHGIRDDTVDADAGEQQREPGEARRTTTPAGAR